MQNALFPEDLLEKIRAIEIIPVVVIDDPASAVPLAQALQKGGISAIELTLRTPVAFEALANIRRECPDILAGLGTVLTTDQVSQAVDHGASFGVAPGLNPEIVRAAAAAGLPFVPGITTPSDIERAISLNCRLLKFFPAEPSGGVSYLKSLSAPYAHLGLEYIPLGGLSAHNFTNYLALKYVPAVGGSWLAPRDVVKRQDWDAVTRCVRDAVSRIHHP